MFFAEDPKVGVKTIKTYAERMRGEGVNRAIMVVQVGSQDASDSLHLRMIMTSCQPPGYLQAF